MRCLLVHDCTVRRKLNGILREGSPGGFGFTRYMYCSCLETIESSYAYHLEPIDKYGMIIYSHKILSTLLLYIYKLVLVTKCLLLVVAWM